METDGSSTNVLAFGMSLEVSYIIRTVSSVREARALPRGSIIGDLHGGLTFTDAVANALENRSAGGWQEYKCSDGNTWTIIVLNR